MLNSKAITKIQSAILICIIVVAAVGGALAYVLLNGEATSETIKIGFFADLDHDPAILHGPLLAAEQLNEEGGILGRQVEIIGEDNDVSTAGTDVSVLSSALNRLLTYHKVDFVIGISGIYGFMVQDSIAQYEKIYFEVGMSTEEYTQRVLDDYDSYKYFFRVMWNETSGSQGMTDSLVHLRELTGFNKVGYLFYESPGGNPYDLDNALPEAGFDLVYKGFCPVGTVDFTSYFAAAEAAGVEVLISFIIFNEAVAFVKEYHDRQSPMLIYGGVLGGDVGDPEGWEITGGKCEYISIGVGPIHTGYPVTTKTLPVREAYMNRWGGEDVHGNGIMAYDIIRYILPDAIERAGTLEVDAVIQALETTSIETSQARNFVFTESHDLMTGENPNDPDADYMLIFQCQWQDGELVPVYPKSIMEKAGTTLAFPDWPGPWD